MLTVIAKVSTRTHTGVTSYTCAAIPTVWKTLRYKRRKIPQLIDTMREYNNLSYLEREDVLLLEFLPRLVLRSGVGRRGEGVLHHVQGGLS